MSGLQGWAQNTAFPTNPAMPQVQSSCRCLSSWTWLFSQLSFRSLSLYGSEGQGFLGHNSSLPLFSLYLFFYKLERNVVLFQHLSIGHSDPTPSIPSCFPEATLWLSLSKSHWILDPGTKPVWMMNIRICSPWAHFFFLAVNINQDFYHHQLLNTTETNSQWL